ncbi:hypothetical protein LGV61_05285 [Desulfurispirillum indicum]|uniref:lipid A biosynthesis lauroyl acyltransferase n=1 Tax=Desulfurispirillum indicum TaxID=936456 RepID=UPI001CF932DD|nr:lipid A biosynthesis lauroyl acyltransferase [Desulfurispirillum indicum]UCZ57689.1 hypothetical protein LGV61_05285 [Desulfurispirillum indicum]
MKDVFYSTILRSFGFLVTHLPSGFRTRLLNALSSAIFFLNRYHRRIVLTNLEFAFGSELTPRERNEIARRTYRNFVHYLAHFLMRFGKPMEVIRRSVTIKNEEIFTTALASGKPVIVITAHYGNWELIGPMIGSFYAPITAVGKKVKSETISRELFSHRVMGDVEVLESKGAIKGLMKAMKAGRVLGLVVDQNTRKKESVVVDFFGRRARHIDSAARLARRTGAIIVPVFVHSEDHQHFIMTFHEPILTARTDDEQSDILASVQAQASITEQVIRQKPDEYFWFHKRFKAEYPQLYTKKR